MFRGDLPFKTLETSPARNFRLPCKFTLNFHFFDKFLQHYRWPSFLMRVLLNYLNFTLKMFPGKEFKMPEEAAPQRPHLRTIAVCCVSVLKLLSFPCFSETFFDPKCRRSSFRSVSLALEIKIVGEIRKVLYWWVKFFNTSDHKTLGYKQLSV